MTKAIISLVDVQISTPNGRPLLSHINYSFEPGKVYLLKGDNGIGKTQLLNTLAGIKKQSHGQIHFELTKNNLSYLPQVESRNFNFPVRLIDIGKKNTSYFPSQLNSLAWNKASGGERKKSLLARSLEDDKKLYILDEPLNHIDTKAQIDVLKRIEEHVNNGACVIMTGHIDITIKQKIDIEVSKWKS